MARKTILDTVRLAARRLFRVSAVDRTLPAAGEAFFQLDNSRAAAQDRASLSAAALPSAQNRQTAEPALFPSVQQTEAEQTVRRETPFSMVRTEKPAALLREASSLVKPSGGEGMSPATTALWAEEPIEKQRAGTALRQGVVPVTKALFSTRIPYLVENTRPEKAEGENGVLRAAEILMADQEQSAAVSTWNRTPVARASQADFSGIAAVEMTGNAAALRQTVSTGTANNAAALRQTVSAGTVDHAPARRQTVGTGTADNAAALRQAVSMGTADNAAALRQTVSAGTVDHAPARRQTVGTGTADNGRTLPPQPAGEETLSALPRPAQETAIDPASGEPSARSSLTVRQKEAALPAEEFWQQWTRRFAGELHSSPEGVHG